MNTFHKISALHVLELSMPSKSKGHIALIVLSDLDQHLQKSSAQARGNHRQLDKLRPSPNYCADFLHLQYLYNLNSSSGL